MSIGFAVRTGIAGGQQYIFLKLLLAAVVVALATMMFNPPEIRGWWIFEYVETPEIYLFCAALLAAIVYLYLITHWFKSGSFDIKSALLAFFGGGLLSIAISMPLYALWQWGAHVTGWSLLSLMQANGTDAGIVEEASKLVAVLLLPGVRSHIRDCKSGLFYAALCALGFAMIENVHYFSEYNHILLGRMNPGHMIFSAIWGAALGAYIAGQISLARFIPMLMLGMALHATWNYATRNEVVFMIVFASVTWKGLLFIRQQLSEPQDINACRDV